MSSRRARKNKTYSKSKGDKRVKGPVMYAYRDASGAKKLISAKEAHAIAEEKKAGDAVAAREAAAKATELAGKEPDAKKSRSLDRMAANHLRRAKRLDRTGYKVGKVAQSMGIRKVTSKHEKPEPASKMANKILKKRTEDK